MARGRLFGMRADGRLRVAIEQMAAAAGVSVSEWLRAMAIREVGQLVQVGQLDSAPAPVGNDAPRETEAEGLPGGISPWLDDWARIKALAAEGSTVTAAAELLKLAPGFTAPPGWRNMPLDEQVAWLDEHYPREVQW